MIKKIPLGQGLSKDKLVWPYVSLGVYTVKSGYNFLSKHRASKSQTSSNPSQYQEVWKHVWSCKVPNKVKSSLWRACKNALPVKITLVHRSVLAEDTCEQCKHLPEDMIHAIWLCSEIFGV